MSTGTQLYERAVNALVRALRDEVDEIPFIMAALVNEYLNAGSLPAGTISQSDYLYTGKGSLQRALIKGRPGNIYKANIDLLNTRVEFGIDADQIRHANTHEYGDTRPITPKMRRFFWAMYYETGHEMWRGLALTKRTTITYKARPYMAPAQKDFEEKELPQMLERIMTRVSIAFNA